MNMTMNSESDIYDIVAAEDGPTLRGYRQRSLDEFAIVEETQEEVAANAPQSELLRRASLTVTKGILSDLEPEKQHLLSDVTRVRTQDEASKRPQPPPRSNTTNAKGKLSTINDNDNEQGNVNAKHQQQQQQEQQQQKVQLNDKLATAATTSAATLGQSENKMTQCGNSATGNPATPTHTKLDIQNFSEDYNNGSSEVIGGNLGETTQQQQQQQQNATTIILTPTSLNLTNTPPNAPGGRGNTDNNTGNNGRGYPAHSTAHYKGPKWWRHLVLHWSVVSEQAALLVIFLVLWALALALLPAYATPDTTIMRILLLFVFAHIAGILVSWIHLPDMLGMLFFGVIYTNVGFANFAGYEKFELFLREMALINIMLLAGLGLDGNAFKRLWFMIMRLTLVPTIVEVAVIAVLAYFTLSMPWLWGIALGLVITAVSPNVVVTVMLKLKEDRLGLNSGIHTLIYAMTTCNDVVAIFMFGVIISLIFSTSSLTQKVLQGPIGIGIGLVFGYLYGMMLHYLPSRSAVYCNGLRFVLTILGGTIAVMGSRIIGYTSAGALGCVMLAFIAGIGWKREEHKMTPQQRQAQQISSVPKRLDLLWKFLKPVSFALIGKEINFAVLDGRVIGFGALLVLLGSLFRLAFAYLSTYGGNLSRKERAYITISGFPKATVQAALGPVALDFARSASASIEVLALANNVLIISVLAIIFTAPLGAILMLRLAPFWLKHGDTVDTAVRPVSASPVSNAGELTAVNAQKNGK